MMDLIRAHEWTPFEMIACAVAVSLALALLINLGIDCVIGPPQEDGHDGT